MQNVGVLLFDILYIFFPSDNYRDSGILPSSSALSFRCLGMCLVINACHIHLLLHNTPHLSSATMHQTGSRLLLLVCMRKVTLKWLSVVAQKNLLKGQYFCSSCKHYRFQEQLPMHTALPLCALLFGVQLVAVWCKKCTHHLLRWEQTRALKSTLQVHCSECCNRLLWHKKK